MEKQAASSLKTKPDNINRQTGTGLLPDHLIICGFQSFLRRNNYSHKNDVPPLGVGRNGTGNGCKAIRVDDGLLSLHEFGQTSLQLQVNICQVETTEEPVVMLSDKYTRAKIHINPTR